MKKILVNKNTDDETTRQFKELKENFKELNFGFLDTQKELKEELKKAKSRINYLENYCIDFTKKSRYRTYIVHLKELAPQKIINVDYNESCNASDENFLVLCKGYNKIYFKKEEITYIEMICQPEYIEDNE